MAPSPMTHSTSYLPIRVRWCCDIVVVSRYVAESAWTVGYRKRCMRMPVPRVRVKQLDRTWTSPGRRSHDMFSRPNRTGERMRISDMNWMLVEEYLKRDDRAVLPLGSTEQHSYLRLTVDCILPERVAAEAAEPLGLPVFPVLAYGVTPYFREFPGSISLRVETHLAVVRDILDGMAHSGFRRILIVNGHGGNGAVQQFAQEWAADHAKCRVMFHNWWNAPQTWAKVQAIDRTASHRCGMDNVASTLFPGEKMCAAQR